MLYRLCRRYSTKASENSISSDALTLLSLIGKQRWGPSVESSIISSGITISNDIIHELLTSLSEPKIALRLFLWARNQSHLELKPQSFHLIKKLWGHTKNFNAFLEISEKFYGSSCSMSKKRFTVLIMGYGRAGMVEEAMTVLDSMETYGCKPDLVHFNCVLDTLIKSERMEEAKGFYARMLESGLSPNVITHTIMISGLGKSGNLGSACNHFLRIIEEGFEPDLQAFTALMYSLCKAKESNRAFELFEKMQDEHVHPSIFTFVALLKACAKVKNMKKGRELHIEITKHSYERDPHVGNILIDMYAKCGSLTEAHYIFTSLAIRDVVSWNTMMAAYVDHRYDEEALELLDEMRDADMCPNHVTLICGLKACGNGRALKKGQALHTEIACEGYDSAFNNIGSTLIDMYVKCGLMTEAQDVFDNLGERDAVAWNALIVGYAEHSRGKEVLGFLEKMKAQAMSPDVVALAYGIKACSRIGDIGNGHVIHMESVKHGLETDDLIGSTLIDMYAKFGMLAKAQEVLKELSSRDVVSWSALIAGYAEQGQCHEALNCLQWMQTEGLSPDKVTFVSILSACSHSGRLDEAQVLLENMTTKYYVIPKLEHHISMVVAFGCAGHFDQAMSVIKMMPSSNCPAICLALLSACRNLMNVNLGIFVFYQAV